MLQHSTSNSPFTDSSNSPYLELACSCQAFIATTGYLPKNLAQYLQLPAFWTCKPIYEQLHEIQQKIGDEKVKEWLAASYLVVAANTPLKSKQIINPTTHTRNIEVSKESRKLAQQSFANLARISHALSDGNVSQQIGIISTGSKSYWMYPGMEGLQEKHQKTDDDLKYLYNHTIERKL